MQYRFLVKENDENPHVWEVYKVYGNDSAGKFVASVIDKEVLELLLAAPATKQMMAGLKKLYPAMTPRARNYKPRTLRDFASAFIGFLRRIS